ncbi:MAG: ABC transporter permease [Vicinamibacterales bacterium]
MTDFRLALRSLYRAPGFALVAILTLALGIGANAAVFSVVDGVLLKPLPYASPDDLVMVWEHNISRDRRTNVVSPGNYVHWRERQTSFVDMAAMFQTSVNLSEGGAPEELRMQIVSEPLFRILGVSPALGRTFRPEEDVPPRSKMLISHGLWHRRFGGDPAILGRKLTIAGQPVEIIGVVPTGFQFLDRNVDVWMPLALPPELRTPRGRSIRVVARLKPGVPIEQAHQEMTRISGGLSSEFPATNKGWSANVQPLSVHVAGDLKPTLLVLLGAVGFVVLVACANVASLLLARAAARQRETAVRTALGATWTRLARQALAESLTLAFLGGAAGLLLAYWLVRVLLVAAERGLTLPRAHEIGLDVRVLAFTALVCIVTGILFGLAPALWSRRASVTNALKDAGRSGTSARAARARAVLVVGEIALAMVLLTGAGLMLQSFARLTAVEPGFETERIMTFSVALPPAQYSGKSRQFFEQLHERLRAMPFVSAAGAISFLPMTGPASATSYRPEGHPQLEAGAMPVTEVRVISGDYFSVMGIPLKAGRLFNADEHRQDRNVVVISEAMAEQAFPGQNPIGKRVSISWVNDDFQEVIGVVGDIRHANLGEPTRAMIYWPHVKNAYTTMFAVVRTTGDPQTIVASARADVQRLDPVQPIANVRTLEQIVSASVAQPRLIARLLAVFAAVALILAAIGIYGVVAYSVSQRTREIGIRVALGASRGSVVRLILTHGVILAAAGLAIGIPSALLLARAMKTLLFETPPGDPLTLGVVALVLGGAALAACLVPLRKALRVDPANALRSE